MIQLLVRDFFFLVCITADMTDKTQYFVSIAYGYASTCSQHERQENFTVSVPDGLRNPDKNRKTHILTVNILMNRL